MSQNSLIRSLLSKALVSFSVLIGLTPLFAQNNSQIKKSNRAWPNSVVAKPIFFDNFSTGTIAADKWRYGANAGNRAAVINNALQLQSQGAESGWIITRNAYPARHTTITLKVLQPNNDGNLGISPTYNLSSTVGIYNEPNFYRFYTHRSDTSGNYRLYVESRKNGALNGRDVTGNLVITPLSGVYLRLRFDETNIFFEAALDGVNWTDMYHETFALPGYTLDSPFYYELAAYKTSLLGVFAVDDFLITSTDIASPQVSAIAAQSITSSTAQIVWQTDEPADSQIDYGPDSNYGYTSPLAAKPVTAHAVTLADLTANTTYHYRVRSQDVAGNSTVSGDLFFQTGAVPLEQIVLDDPLNNNTRGTRTGGKFVAGGGWQVTGVEDMIVYDLGRYLESGSLELEVRNFQPMLQNSAKRHHFLSFFRTPWGNHHPVENPETVWDLHAGSYYAGGVKILSWTYDHSDSHTVVPAAWDLSKTYRLKIIWNGNRLQYFRNDTLQATNTHATAMQLRHLFLGRDFTVSADLVTNFKNNQYPAIVGPIYSNLIVKENVAADDRFPPQIAKIMPSALYANAARLTWTTNEPAVVYVEYGLTAIYDRRTPVLGPPAQTFSTALANLVPNQIYHYRLVALDEAGNLATSTDQTFTTLRDSLYLFKPVADTYVEQAGLYGTTRDHGNFGWMNLLSGAGRESYLRFALSGLSGNVVQASLRLHGRQSGKSGGALRALSMDWDENNVTWLTKPTVSGRLLDSMNSVQAGQWHEVNVGSAVVGNGMYNFALIGAGADVVSFDSRESTNSQPELIVTVGGGSAPKLNLLSPNGGEWFFTGVNHQITWNGANTIAQVKLEFSPDAGVSWRPIVASTPNNGLYNWQTPPAVSNTALIRISAATAAGVTDISDGTFFLVLSALVNFKPAAGNPILQPGPPGSWDENIRERGWFMYENGMYHVWYGGWQGAYDHAVPNLVKLGYAYSTDGINWTKYAGNPIYTQKWTEDIAVVKDGGTYYLYAEDENTADGDGAVIDLYTSTDKINWTRYGTVLAPTGNAWESSDVGTPTVWKEGHTWYMLYEGLRNSIAGQVGLATSSDGKSWTRDAGNPVLANPHDAQLDIAIDSIINISGVYYAYGHYDTGGHKWVGAMLASTNLTAWAIYPDHSSFFNSPVIVDNGVNYLLYGLAANSSGVAPYNVGFAQPIIVPPAPASLMFKATDDAYVNSSRIARNYGRAGDLRLRQAGAAHMNAYVKFSVMGLNGNVQSAKLRLHVGAGSEDGGSVYAVSNNYLGTSTPWQETGLIWNNAPIFVSAPLGSAGAVSAGQIVELDVTAAITGNGVYSFGLKNGSSTSVYYGTKEGAQAPELVIQTAEANPISAEASNTANTKLQKPELTPPLPERFVLYPSHPNPLRIFAANAEARIVYALPERAHVTLALYDLLGRRVKILVDAEREAGTYEVAWSGRDASGQLLPSGTYLYTMQARDFSSAKKLLLVK